MEAAYMIRTFFGQAEMNDPATATSREYLQVAAKGAYAASTICGCNSRKYHGLLVAPQPQIDNDHHVLLSALEETLLCESTAWRLNTQRYTGVYYPDGNRYIREFYASPLPQWIYSCGHAVVKKELLFAAAENTLLIRYTLLEAPCPVTLRLTPLLAFRNMHWLSKKNEHVNHHITEVAGGIATTLYPGYTPVYLQLSGCPGFTHAADWYYNIEYPEEQQRGYDFHEDLYTPGYFEVPLAPGQSVVFAAGTRESRPDACEEQFRQLLSSQTVPHTTKEYLLQAARQFILHTPAGTIVKGGYYWFGAWGRDTCISLPGLTLLTGNVSLFRQVADTLLADLKDGLLPNAGKGEQAIYNTVDASLWLVWALQQYARYSRNAAAVWETYGHYLAAILWHYRQGTRYGIQMDENGLITAGQEGYALTWMDAIVDGVPVTPRRGKAVEVNALWYNAVCCCLQLARAAGDEDFIQAWESLPEQICASFTRCFWDGDKKYLADCVQDEQQDWSVRPNQLLAVSLPFSPLTPEQQAAVMDKVRDELLTPRGLRTLSPEDERYCGHYGGDQPTRDRAYHQGTIWPWLLAHFAEAYLEVYREHALPLLETIYEDMTPALQECCLYSVAEVFDGDYPYKAGGAVAQAWSVAELLRFRHIIDTFKTGRAANGLYPGNMEQNTILCRY